MVHHQIPWKKKKTKIAQTALHHRKSMENPPIFRKTGKNRNHAPKNFSLCQRCLLSIINLSEAPIEGQNMERWKHGIFPRNVMIYMYSSGWTKYVIIYIYHIYIYITIDTCYIHVAFRKLSLWLYFVAAHVTGFTRMSAVKHRKTSWVSVGDGWFHLWQKLVRWSNVTMLFVGDIGL